MEFPVDVDALLTLTTMLATKYITTTTTTRTVTVTKRLQPSDDPWAFHIQEPPRQIKQQRLDLTKTLAPAGKPTTASTSVPDDNTISYDGFSDGSDDKPIARRTRAVITPDEREQMEAELALRVSARTFKKSLARATVVLPHALQQHHDSYDSKTKAGDKNKNIANGYITFLATVAWSWNDGGSVYLMDDLTENSCHYLRCAHWPKDRIHVANHNIKAATALAQTSKLATWHASSWNSFLRKQANDRRRVSLAWYDGMATLRKILEDLYLTFELVNFVEGAFFALTYCFRDNQAEEKMELAPWHVKVAQENGLGPALYRCAQEVEKAAAASGRRAEPCWVFKYPLMHMVVYRIWTDQQQQ
jgi:hypothetical protein